MIVNSYLNNIANSAILRNEEKENIQRSIVTLKERLNLHFSDQISEHFVFGSYSRGTILPRIMDSQSDVDYMVIFTEKDLQPQSYLDRLRRFSEFRYSTSETAQSHPTLVLDLNHIRFELVPALKNWYGNNFRIPEKRLNYQSWQETDPKGFNDKLTRANQINGNIIKPLIRVMKYWNAKSGYPFESYNLEKIVVNHSYSIFGYLPQISDYFYLIVEALEINHFSKLNKESVIHLKKMVSQVKIFDHAGQFAQAEYILMKLLPPIR